MTTANNNIAQRLSTANKKLAMALQQESPAEAETALVMMVRDLQRMEVGPHDAALIVKGVSEMMDRCLAILQRDNDLSSQNLELIQQNAALKGENRTLKHRVALLEAMPPPPRRKKGKPPEAVPVKSKRKRQQLGESQHRRLLEAIARHEDGIAYEQLKAEVSGFFWADARLHELTGIEYGEPALVAVPRPDSDRPLYRITDFGRRLLETRAAAPRG